MNRDISAIRNDYSKASLEIGDVHSNPVQQFKKWFEEALNSDLYEPTAMFLSTSNLQGQPSGRVVLLKELLNEGFVFFTNYSSRKGKDIAENPFVALTFFWPELERQIRIEGKIEKVDEKTSDTYFNSRPLASQIGAMASPQSSKIAGREVLEAKIEEISKQVDAENLPKRPENWGGYIVKPHRIEFWQGRPSRLHDRILYELSDSHWEISRLAP